MKINEIRVLIQPDLMIYRLMRLIKILLQMLLMYRNFILKQIHQRRYQYLRRTIQSHISIKTLKMKPR
jgi:hypothetical protein